MTDVSNTIFIDAGTTITNPKIGDSTRPFKTIDSAVDAVQPQTQEWLLSIVPGNYIMDKLEYTGFIFSGDGDDDTPQIQINRPMAWKNLTFTNIGIVFIYNDDFIFFEFGVLIVGDKGVDIQNDCYVNVFDNMQNNITTRFTLFINQGLFRIDCGGNINLPNVNFTYLNNGDFLKSKIGNKSMALITLPSNIVMKEGILLINNYDVFKSVLLVSLTKSNTYQNIIKAVNGPLTFIRCNLLVGDIFNPDETIVGLSNIQASLRSDFKIILFEINTNNKILLYKSKHITNILKKQNKNLISGSINNNLLDDIKSCSETIYGITNNYGSNNTFVNSINNKVQNLDLFEDIGNAVFASYNSGYSVVPTNTASPPPPVKEDNLLLNILESIESIIIDISSLISKNSTYLGMKIPDTDRGNNLLSTSLVSNNVKFTKPIYLELTQSRGSSYRGGSDLNSLVDIDNDYIHTYYDGSYFMVDAQYKDITITIPKTEVFEESNWQGRHIRYKRIDTTDHKVHIINERGLFDNRHKKIRLNNKIKYDKKHCKHKRKVKLGKKQIIVRYNGDAYVL